ncbi:FARSA [Mytilus edulis]|uniref:FARSA n=1 Tax=Mytilus edulis TaxID=6550 RepID=A0A8S3VF77_MYTED|nr:FARSA [Mytilus edulis]
MICPVLHATLKHSLRRFQLIRCCYCTSPKLSEKNGTIELLGKTYKTDHVTNIRSSLIPKIGIGLHNMKHHPLNLLKKQIVDYFYKNFINRQKNPVFSVYDSISPVVTLHQNFDSLLVPVDHVSRKLSESFYLNSEYMLRAHTSAHQSDLIRTGLNAFLVFGDVYRRDTIDSSHYPIFHQAEGVRLYRGQELFSKMNITGDYQIFENGEKNETKQPLHTKEAVMILEHELKSTLENLAFELFGKAGAGDQIGWAFGLGLERLAMRLYSIPDIRQFWRYNDSGFMSQFDVKDPSTPIKYKVTECFNFST